MKKIVPQLGITPKVTAREPRRRDLVLYVEDNDDNWHIAQLRLSDGYELVRAANAREACRLLAARGAEFSAVLMDIELRGSELNGVELVELMRGKRPRASAPDFARELPNLAAPIIFVTAHGAKYADDTLLAAGGDQVIAKPVDFGALSLALTHLHLSKAARHRRTP
ncbi:MAG: Multi-sensor hybrid histidine kinase [Myxococcaceae bacterium]|nr:Multi-sensor hybrid histidine kinase [Myxococcaceae bacterium]